MMRAKARLSFAVALILLGVLLLLAQFNVALPGWDKIWPALPLAAGVALLIRYVLGGRRGSGHVFLGTFALLVGLSFFFITLGPLASADLAAWWPVFLIAAGIAFLAQRAATRFHGRYTLFLAVVALALGGVELADNLGWFRPAARERLPDLWPAVVILAGLFLLLRGIFSRRR